MIVNKNRGFTLIEILLALAILGVGMVGILSVFTIGTNSIRRTVTMTEAGFIGQMVIEDLKRQAVSGDPAGAAVTDEYKNYYEDYEVEPVSPSAVPGIPNLYKVEVAVKRKGSDRPLVEFTTYLTKYEP